MGETALFHLDAVEAHRILEEGEEIRHGGLRVEAVLHVGVDARGVGAVTQPRIAPLVQPITPLERARVAIR